MNRRQQVRNERALQELIKNVAGNDKCADCGARNPGWASWSLGIFLCLRCAALHRKLGTHISKVKSLSMDQWNVEQVENMKRMGNTASNRIYNPRNAKPSIPIDVDEVDGVMERFIRQKYESKTLSNESSPSSRHHTGSTSSDDRPATLPPKPPKRFHFGLRSASSTLPQSRSDKASPPMSPTGLGGFGRDLSPPRNKPAKVFGADIGGSRDDNYKVKLMQLKEMGFPDEKKNLAILKGLNGNIDRAVEELVRLGEGSRRSSRNTTPAPRSGINGISIEKARPLAANGKTTTPFDAADTSKSLPPLPASSPVLQQPTSEVTPQTTQPPNLYNPFLQPQQSLDQSFQGLQISQQAQQMQPPQQLFPNTTGGYGSQPHAQNPFLQTYTPPPMLTSTPPSSFQQNQFTAPAPFPFQPQQPVPQPTSSDALNPFLRPSRSQVFNSTNPFENQVMASPPVQQSTQPFTYESFSQVQQPQQTQVQSQPQPTFQTQYTQTSTYPAPTQPQQSNYNPFQQSAPPQQSQYFFQQALVQSPQAEQSFQFQPQAAQLQPQSQQSLYQQQSSNNTFPTQMLQQQQQQQQQQQLLPPQQQHHQSTFPPIRYDKSSILALYNTPNPTPTSTLPTSITLQAAADPNPALKRSVTMPITTITPPTDTSPPPGSHNPFAAAIAPQQQLQGPATNGFRHTSNESVDFAGFASGRHSPDAFAGLSARVSTPRLR